VRNRNYSQSVTIDAIDEAKRKFAQWKPTMPRIKWLAHLRHHAKQRGDSPDFLYQLGAEPKASLLTNFQRGGNFLFASG
jgi:hypothetical protein